MSNQIGINLTYLKLLEASQSAFESSEKALKVAEEALTAAKIVHVEAKAALDIWDTMNHHATTRCD